MRDRTERDDAREKAATDRAREREDSYNSVGTEVSIGNRISRGSRRLEAAVNGMRGVREGTFEALLQTLQWPNDTRCFPQWWAWRSHRRKKNA